MLLLLLLLCCTCFRILAHVNRKQQWGIIVSKSHMSAASAPSWTAQRMDLEPSLPYLYR